MNYESTESRSRFEQFAADSGSSVGALSATDATRLMLAFYQEVRADDCPLDEDGDMILFQWGAYAFGDGETYRYDLTRQFITSGNEGDDGMSQLSLTVHYAASDALRALKGNRWCWSPEHAEPLPQFISSHEATTAVSSLTPLRTTLVWSPI